jgi:hypothetical protein
LIIEDAGKRESEVDFTVPSYLSYLG